MGDAHKDEQWRAQRRHRQALDKIAVARASEFIGKTVEAARALANDCQLKLRLIELPPSGTVAWTQEYELGRITAFASNGVITACSAG